MLESHGFRLARQRGSHMVMQKSGGDCGSITVPVPDHDELRTGTLRNPVPFSTRKGKERSLLRARPPRSCPARKWTMRTRKTKIPGANRLGLGTLRSIIRQSGLTVDAFRK
ncbi:MAG: type II toxin-antitoxin system HicA family toxin [Verrucomicrobiales bacterium]